MLKFRFLKEKNIRDRLRSGCTECVLREPYAAKEIRFSGQITAERIIVLIHSSCGGDKRHYSAGLQLVYGFGEEIIVDKIFVIFRVVWLEIPERHVPNNHIECAVFELCTLKSTVLYFRFGVEFLCDTGGQAVEFNAVQMAVLCHFRREIPEEVSIFGTAYEFIYTDEDGQPRLYSPDPRQAFVIYDDTVRQKPVAGVYYYKLHDSVTNQDTGYSVYLCDTENVMHFTTDTGFSVTGVAESRPHGMGGVPLIEIYNNSTCGSDFEPVLSLIDAYNVLQSDRVNDKEQFVEAILLIKGSVLGDDNDEKSESYKALRENGLLELDADSSAEWLTRQFDENSVEVLRKSLEQDIHKFANVPCMSDESFGGNASGVAMRYKLLGFEQITKIKERYFREGLKERLRLLCNWLSTTGKAAISSRDISIQFTRALPVNETEVAQLVSELRDMVPREILLGLLPFVDDPEGAAEKVREQQNDFPNLPPDMTDEQS